MAHGMINRNHTLTCFLLVALAASIALGEGTDAAPRYQAVRVPVLPVSDSPYCCTAEATGFGPGETVLGAVGSSLISIGKHGFSWRDGESPRDLTGDAFTTAYPQLMNEAGWIAGTAYSCPPSDGACDTVLFFVSPNGELIDLGTSERIPRTVALAEDNTLLYYDYGGSTWLLTPGGNPEQLSGPPGTTWSRAYGMTPDGRTIAGVVRLENRHYPTRWVDGVYELLSMPAGATFSPWQACVLDEAGGVTSSLLLEGDSERTLVRWNGDGMFHLLPRPAEACCDISVLHADNELVVGAMTIASDDVLVIWPLDGDQPGEPVVRSLGGDWALHGRVLPAGDQLVIHVFDTQTYFQDLLVMSRNGGEIRHCADLIVIGSIDPATDGRPNEAFVARDTDAILINVGSPTSSSFILKRLRTGDLDGDGVVDGADLTILLGAWGTLDVTADIDANGVVDGTDLALLLGDWG